jgi:hypothetical protein
MSESKSPSGEIIVTPVFPQGIPVGDLRPMPNGIIRETITTWFLMSCVPVTGPVFGFAEGNRTSAALNSGPLNTFAMNQGRRRENFGRGNFRTGEQASDLITGVFEGVAPAYLIAEVAALFDGVWERKPKIQPAAAPSELADIQATLLSVLDALTGTFAKLTPEYGGMGHNHPPEALPLTEEDRVVTLRAIGEMRLAVSSGADYSVVDALWQGIWFVVQKVAAWSIEKIKIWVDEAVKVSVKPVVYAAIAGLVAWEDGERISGWLSLLKSFLPK